MNVIDKTIIESEYFNLINQGKAVLSDGYYIGNNKLMFVEPISENCKWDKENRVWIDLSIDLDKIQAQIDEYSAMDTPSILKEMGETLAKECIDMLINLRKMAYEIQTSTEVDNVSFRSMSMFTKHELVLPKPSPELEAFKNKFHKYF